MPPSALASFGSMFSYTKKSFLLYLQTTLQAYKIYHRHLIKTEIWAHESD